MTWHPDENMAVVLNVNGSSLENRGISGFGFMGLLVMLVFPPSYTSIC